MCNYGILFFQILPCMVDLAGGMVPESVSVLICDQVKILIIGD